MFPCLPYWHKCCCCCIHLSGKINEKKIDRSRKQTVVLRRCFRLVYKHTDTKYLFINCRSYPLSLGKKMIDYFFLKLSFIKEQIRFYSIEALFFLRIVLEKIFLWKYASYLKSGREKFISLQSSALWHIFFSVFQLTPKVITDINQVTHYIITINELHINNWRRLTLDRKKWREIINKNVYIKPVSANIKDIVYQYKKQAAQRRRIDLAASTGQIKRRVTEVLVKQNNHYKCPGCKLNFKAQGITNHVKSCVDARMWCKRNRIIWTKWWFYTC